MTRRARILNVVCVASSAMFALVAGVAGCSGENLKPLDKEDPPKIVETQLARVEADFCTTEASKLTTSLKFLFIIDKSGSNKDNITSPGTDIDGARRYLPLLSFLEKRSSIPTMSFGLLNFSTKPARRLVEDTAEMRGTLFSNDAKLFEALVEKERSPAGSAPAPDDNGWTNYVDTLREARKVIEEDVAAEKQKANPVVANYVLFFVSDGAPIVGEENGKPIYQPTEQVLAAGNAIMALEKTYPDFIASITMNVAYYYSTVNDAAAEGYMRALAKETQGSFQTFSGDTRVDFEQFSVPSRNAKNALTEVFVENANAVWEEGRLLADTDGDGLSDERERKLKSNPLSADSDGNGLGDAVEIYTQGAVCKDGQCRSQGALSRSECGAWRDPAASAAPSGAPGGPSGARYLDADNDGLNDCEELLVGSDRTRFDSNLDGVPDAVAFRNRISVVGGAEEIDSDADFDGSSNKQEIKEQTAINYDNRKFVDLKRLRYRLEKVSESDAQACYRLEVDDMKILPLADGSDNKVRVTLLEGNSLLSSRRLLRLGAKKVAKADNHTVKFGNAELK